jgi:hypothetical protein
MTILTTLNKRGITYNDNKHSIRVALLIMTILITLNKGGITYKDNTYNTQ